MNRRKSAWYVSRLVVLTILGVGLSGSAFGVSASQAAAPEDAAFDLKEISVFDIPLPVRFSFIFGQFVTCQTEPNEQVQRYPQFISERPLYGSLIVGPLPGSRNSGLCYHFAVDESAGTGRGYDRLYFDAGLDLDLTDDRSGGIWNGVPEASRVISLGAQANTYFEPLQIRPDPNDVSEYRLEVLPRLLVFDSSELSAGVAFATMRARQGRVEIGERRCLAILGHARHFPGWFDHPTTALYLLPADADQPGPGRVVRFAGDQLMTIHRCNGTFYRFTATAAGDKLFVQPYRGPLGTLEIGSGGRDVRPLSLSGSLRSSETALSLSEQLGEMGPESARSHRLPVGDYAPSLISVTYGRLQCAVMPNYHADGRPRGRLLDSSQDYRIKIRENQPFVLDFSSKPEVLFALPARDHHVKLGEELSVKAALLDPALNLVFRAIRQQQQLDPKVAIKRTGGEVVAEGVMPFG